MEIITDRKVLLMAASSRLAVFVMQVIFNGLMADHQPDIFNPPATERDKSIVDHIVELLLGGLRRWDSIYFIHISEHGYTYENTLAFFPALPMLTRAVGHTLLYPLHNYLTLRHIMMISALLLNTCSFVMATWYLFKLGKVLLGKGNHSWYAATLFCFNPASIFMSACYSESLFALSSFALMYHLEKREYTKATFALGLATATRSNGVVMAGYPIYMMMKLILTGNQADRAPIALARSWFKLISCILYGLLPFVFFQYMAFFLYCKKRAMPIPMLLLNYGKEQGYHMPRDEPNEWCYYTLPFSYGYIQASHWGVGLFKYYEWKQLPNFLLALPVIIISFYSISHYISKCKDSLVELRSVRPWIDSQAMRVFPYTIHLLFLLVWGICTIHIQVLTRLTFSSTPLLYFCMAKHVSQYFVLKRSSRMFKSVTYYFLFYFVAGTLLHSNAQPWT